MSIALQNMKNLDTNLSAYWNPMPGTPEEQKYDEIREEERREMEEYYRNNPGLFV